MTGGTVFVFVVGIVFNSRRRKISRRNDLFAFKQSGEFLTVEFSIVVGKSDVGLGIIYRCTAEVENLLYTFGDEMRIKRFAIKGDAVFRVGTDIVI